MQTNEPFLYHNADFALPNHNSQSLTQNFYCVIGHAKIERNMATTSSVVVQCVTSFKRGTVFFKSTQQNSKCHTPVGSIFKV